MKQELIVLLKEDIAYQDRSKECIRCSNYKEVADHFVDRTWNSVCTLFQYSLGMLPVSPDGCCKHYSTKT